MASRIRITGRQRDKAGNIWLRDNYGGWINEYGVRFTKKEHQRFGYRIRKANQEIAKYNQKYPLPRQMQATGVTRTYRKEDLARFRRKSSYRYYLQVTERIITGREFYYKLPNNYRSNMIKSLYEASVILRRMGYDANSYIEKIIKKLRNLSIDDIIALSQNPLTPDIKQYYVTEGSVLLQALSRLDTLTE